MKHPQHREIVGDGMAALDREDGGDLAGLPDALDIGCAQGSSI
jgi:hypothetical protein